MMITVTVASLKPGEMDGKLSDFMDRLRVVMAEVPPEYRDEVVIDYDRGHEYGDEELNFTYSRMETPEEVAEREARDARYAQNRLDEKRRQYERLKAELGIR